jgi:magnesium-transporting ATPase (P-type)
MVTGDHPATALSIARELGIASDEREVATGPQLVKIGSETLFQCLDLIKTVKVFARVTPLQKYQIIDALVGLGHFVAVTGDGVNDAPALRRAHLGVAMGSGTDVAKDSAAMIITDDCFSSIVAGIEEGRFAYDNIRKVIALLISCGVAEILLFTVALLTGLPLPLTAVQLLWLNLVTNGPQDVALAFEAGEADVMSRKPRKPTEGIFDKLMIQQTVVAGFVMGLVASGAWYWWLMAGLEEATARNLLLLLMVFLENVHVFNCRSERQSAFRVPLRNNWILMFGVLAAQGIHILALYVPLTQDILHVAPVTFVDWGSLLLLASTILVTMELFKVIKRKIVNR